MNRIGTLSPAMAKYSKEYPSFYLNLEEFFAFLRCENIIFYSMDPVTAVDDLAVLLDLKYIA